MDFSKDPSTLLSSLLNGAAEFEIPCCPEPEEEHVTEKVFSFENIAPHIYMDHLGYNDEGVSGQAPLSEIALKMEDVLPDGRIKKRIIRPGKEKVPKLSVVYFHYNSYLEFEGVPFDSTFLRDQKPIRIQLGVGAIYQGMELSLLSMCVGEKAHFLVHPSLAFGKLGVPPRIAPNATIFNIVEVFSIVDCGATISQDRALDPIEVADTFEAHCQKVQGFINLAKDHFVGGLISGALENYKRALSAFASIKPEDRDNEIAEELLVKIHVNKMICYNTKKINKPRSTIETAREIIHLVPHRCRRNAKFFFNLGKAHLALLDYGKATSNFKKALSLEPVNPAINKALEDLNSLHGKALVAEKKLCAKALGLNEPPKPPKKDIFDTMKDNMRDEYFEQLQKFANGTKCRMGMGNGLTWYEKDLIKECCDKLNLHCLDDKERKNFYISHFEM